MSTSFEFGEIIDRDRIGALLIDISSLLEEAERARFEFQRECAGESVAEPLDVPLDVLEQYLDEASVLIVLALDIAGLKQMLGIFDKTWRRFQRVGLKETRFIPEVDYLESKPLHYLNTTLRGLTTLLLFLGIVVTHMT